jgi:hypothetical protein
MDVGNLAQWAGVLATTSAVVVALFKEEILRRLKHPELTASIEAKHPYCIRTPLQESYEGLPWNGSRYFLRLWVMNKGNSRAEKVEVFLSQALVQGTNGSFEPVPKFTPMNLRWSYTDYNDPDIYVDGISPGMRRLCDFGAISDPSCPSLKSLSTGSEKADSPVAQTRIASD